MGEKFRYLIPFVSALFATSVVLEPDQPDRTSKSDSNLSTRRPGLLWVFIMIHHTEDQNQRFWRISEGLHAPIAVI